jgi:hypothetical protein
VKLLFARIEYVLINEDKKDQHSGQPARRTGSMLCAGVGREGAVATLTEELRPEQHGEILEVTRMDVIREGVNYHPQEFVVPAKEMRAARAAVSADVAKTRRARKPKPDSNVGVATEESPT